MAVSLQLFAECNEGLHVTAAANNLYDNVELNTPSSMDGESAANATVGCPRLPFGCPSDKCPREMRIEIDVYASVVREAVSGRQPQTCTAQTYW
jgi:hypothetical protein